MTQESKRKSDPCSDSATSGAHSGSGGRAGVGRIGMQSLRPVSAKALLRQQAGCHRGLGWGDGDCRAEDPGP